MPDQQPKSTTIQIPAMNEVVAALLADTCRRDENFRAELQKDARKTFADRGVLLADGMNVRLVQNTADTVHVALPCYDSFDKSFSDLTDEQLQAISGGEIIITIIFAIGGALTAVGTAVGAGASALAVGGAVVGTVAAGAVAAGAVAAGVGGAHATGQL